MGGGLAGSECALQLAARGHDVVLHEMRGVRSTPAHKTDKLAELVCSNTFKSTELGNAHGLLKAEMRLLGCALLEAADAARIPAGTALAVDREVFSGSVHDRVAAHPRIRIERGEVTTIPSPAVIASGPLTSDALAGAVRARLGVESLAFYDAIAPIVDAGSLDRSVVFAASRYDKETMEGEQDAYLNCPMNREEYEAFIAALGAADQFTAKEFDQVPYFEGCMPVEEMARRGPETLRFGPMKPVGLTDPNTGRRAHAVVQLRQDNALGTLFNIVGFQTKLKHAEQKRVFRTIPGLENAEFARLGGLHRNTFLNSPTLLDGTLRLNAQPRLRFAGQITGVEGYVESAAIGLLAGRFAAAERLGQAPRVPPQTTALGALLAHVTGGANAETFQPMNCNFGLFRPLQIGRAHV